MQPSEKIREYSKAVCSRIRWKKAHSVITEEIENHLIDQRDAYMEKGADEPSATDMALAQMGDPIIIGTQLDRTCRPKSQWVVLVCAAAFICIGVFLQIIFGMHFGSHLWILYPLIGLMLLAGPCFMDFTWIGRHAVKIYLALMVLFATFLVMKQMGTSFDMFINDGFIPLLFPFGFAGVVYSARNKGYKGIALCGIAFLLPAMFMLFMRLRWELMLFAVSGLVILCLAVSKGWFRVRKLNGYLLVFIPVLIILLLAAVIILNNGYLLEKVKIIFNPSLDTLNQHSFGKEIRTALAGSKFLGQGTVPDAAQEPGYNIFCILTSLIYYSGWISFILVMGLLLFVIIKGFRLCFRQQSGLSLFISISVMMTLTMQVVNFVLFNMGFDLGSPMLFPVSFLGYDFVYFTNMALLGIMLSVFRTGYVVKDRYNGNVLNHYSEHFFPPRMDI